jgi:HAD superfamily hydrolase (TIGR01509 family)
MNTKKLLEAAIILLIGSVINLPLFVSGGAAILWFVIRSPVSQKPILAFDYGGVLAKGDYYTEAISIDPEMKDYVGKLSKKYKTVTVTNDNAIAFPDISKKLGTGKLFAKEYISSDVGAQKPEPAFYERVLNDLKANPDQVVYVDDKKENADAARKLGIPSIHFTSKQDLEGQLARFGVTA